MNTKPDLATELRRQLTELPSPIDRRVRATLRATVYEYVDEAKRLGWAPERVLVAVKRIARDAGLRPSVRVALTVPVTGMTAEDTLLTDLVAWCIERYYDGVPEQHRAPRARAANDVSP